MSRDCIREHFRIFVKNNVISAGYHVLYTVESCQHSFSVSCEEQSFRIRKGV